MNIFQKILSFFMKRKFLSFVIIVVVLAGGYYLYKYLTPAKAQVSYVFAPASKGTIISIVSGTGQVSASSQLDLSPKASGNVVYLPIKEGQKVTAGTLLLEVDPTAAQKSVRDAQASLDSAQLSLQKLVGQGGATNPQNKQNAQDALANDYENGFNTVSNTFLNVPNIMTGLNGLLFGNNIDKNYQNIDYYTNYAKLYSDRATQFHDSAYNSYETALTAYNTNFTDYKTADRQSSTDVINSLINETYNTTKNVSDAVKNYINLIQFYKDQFSANSISTSPVADTQMATLNTYLGQVNGDLSNLLNTQTSIQNDIQTVNNSGLDVQSQQLSLQNAQNNLQDAKDNLANYYVYAPFGGIIAAVNAKVGESSPSPAVSIITSNSIATISLNEVDVAKIKIGQKTTLTFDAIPNLTIAGQVSEIDVTGAVSQGVVSYNVQISLDTQDSRIKPGMSINADIQTAVHQDVLTVPNSAVKIQGASNYVQILVNNVVQRVPVTIGLSDDSNTEITSGLQEGQQVITQTISSASASTGTTNRATNSTIRIPGAGGFGGGGGALNATFRGN
jgi:HlyD family secretion protein